MKKKIIIKRIKEIAEKHGGSNHLTEEMEAINELFEEEKQDQLKLCEARRLGTQGGIDSLIKEVLDKWKKAIEDNTSLHWLRGRLAVFSVELKDSLKKAIIDAGRGEVHWRLDRHAQTQKEG